MKIIFSIFLFFSASLIYANEQEINQLLNKVQTSEIEFERNGQKHSGADARQHLEKKLNWAKRWKLRSQPITTEQFIQKIASRSSMSGDEYYVIKSDGTRMKTEEWLNLEWEKIKSKPENQTPLSQR